MDHSIFNGLDLWVVLYAAWLTAIPDTLTGAAVGTGLAVLIPRVWHPADNFTGVSLLAALGGIAGPRLWDFVSSESGFKAMLYILGNTAAPLLGKFLATQKKDGDADGNKTPPP
jgi:hypothetical protein